MSFVGLDVGGTYLKAAWLAGGRVDGPVHRLSVPSFLDTSGPERELDPAALMASVLALLDEAIGNSVPQGILVTGQMAGVAFTNSEGRGVAPIITWQDTRVTDLEAIRRELSSAEIARLGESIRVGLPLVTLNAMGVPAEARLTSLIGYVAGSLSNTFASRVHTTDAASWGLLDVSRGSWSAHATRLAGIRQEDLPRVTSEVRAVGTSSRFGAPVLCAVGDQQSSLMGAGLTAGVVSVNLATGCQVSVLSGSCASPAQVRPYFYGSYLHTVTHLPAGRLLTSAIAHACGSSESEDWAWALEHWRESDEIARAVFAVVHGICESVDRLGARGLPVLFSGGVAQQFHPIRALVQEALATDTTVYNGDDAALAGLATLSQMIRRRTS